MQTFILPGDCGCNNMGDLAMLQVAVRRLKSLWPDTVFRVVTDQPAELKNHCPEVEPVPWRGCKRWLHAAALPRFFFPDIRPETRRQFPVVLKNLPALARLLVPRDGRAAREFATALFNSDLLLMSGCGMIADEFRLNALRMLSAIDAAIQCNIPTAMFSQGFGPIHNKSLFYCAAQVLPRIDAIFIRERSAGLPLLQKLGVPAEKIFVTGDDAIEPAFHEKPAVSGGRLGVNLRLANYAALDADILETVRAALAEKARQLETTLAGIPILIGGENSDVQTLRQLLGDTDASGDLDTPLKVIRQISTCRVVVTGSYHAAVFALAQGIPVVSIVQSIYYRDKFCGLADLFGGGCAVLQTDEGNFSQKLGAAIDEFWRHADTLKSTLLPAAERQIAAAQAAYARLPELLRPA